MDAKLQGTRHVYPRKKKIVEDRGDIEAKREEMICIKRE